MKVFCYDGRNILDPVTVTRKLDGVQAKRVGNQVLSRKNKPLYNIPVDLLEEDKLYEIYCGDFDLTSSVVRTHAGHPYTITEKDVYELHPSNNRLLVSELHSITSDEVYSLFSAAVRAGDEGLVIYEHRPDGDLLWKVKLRETYDVRILDIQPGKGKNEGKMGALITPMGKVGTGFTDAQRSETWEIGEIIEVVCMHLTKDGKFRHPRFIRHRFDKDTESIPND